MTLPDDEIGKVYYRPTVAAPGEVECCERCMVFRRENPEASPLVVSVNHSDHHVEWVEIGHISHHLDTWYSDRITP